MHENRGEKISIGNQKKIILALDVTLMLGLIAYSVILLTINKTLNPSHFSGFDYEAIHQRFFWRWLAERIFSLCSLVYIAGHIGALCFTMKKKIPVPAGLVFFYFLVQIGILFLCVIPFALFQLDDWGDYLFPLWSVIVILCLLLLTFAIVTLYKKMLAHHKKPSRN